MGPLAFAVHVAAVVLAVAGVSKVADPTAVTRSLAVAGLPSSPAVGRLLGVAELAVGVAVLAVAGAVTAAALAAWYAGFVGYLLVNRLRGLDVPCGCVGGSDRPAGAPHLLVDAAAAAAAAAAVARPVDDVSGWLDEGVGGSLALGGIALVAALVVVVVLPGRIGRTPSGH